MHKKLISLFVLIIISVSIPGFSQIGYSPKIDSLINLITTQSVTFLERQLTGDTSTVIGGSPYTIATRYYNSASNTKAAQFIFERFQEYGYSPRYQVNSSTSTNVIAVKTGTKYPNQYFVIGAHYDNMPSGSITPGADDNASGSVAVMEAARILSNFPTEYSIIFVTFDAEEMGLYGSKAFVDTAYYKGDSIVCNLNFDMIAYDSNSDGTNWVVTNTASESFANDYISTMRTYVPALNPVKTIDLTANSDHASFWTRNYKAFMNIENEDDFTPYYHTVNDKFNTLNLPFFRNIVRTAVAALTSFSKDMKMDFYHTQLNSGNVTTTRTASVVIKSKNGVASGANAPRLYYKINGGSYNVVNFHYSNLDTFKFNIPGQPIGTTVNYYFAAQDLAGNYICTYPAGGRGINPPGTQAPSVTFGYSVETVNYACVGTGTTAVEYPFYTYWHDSRTQMLYTASELATAGGTAGLVKRIGFDVTTVSALQMNGYTVKMQNTNLTSLSGWVSSGFTTTFSGSYTVPGTGMQYLEMNPTFSWDGTSNVLIEICFDNATYTTSSKVNGTTASGMIYHHHLDNSTGCTMTGSTSSTVRPNICIVIQSPTGVVNNTENQPIEYSLSQNYPNPFNPVTKINFAIPKTGFVSLKVYNMLGKEISTLVSDVKNAGYYSVDFDATELSTGVYYYKIESQGFMDVKKMLLIK